MFRAPSRSRWMAWGHRVAVILGVAMAVVALGPGPAWAQSESENPVEAEEPKKPITRNELLKAEVVKSITDMRCLRGLAAQIAPVGSPRYWAVLRESLTNALPDISRARVMVRVNSVAQLRKISPQALDADPVIQKQIDKIYNEGGAPASAATCKEPPKPSAKPKLALAPLTPFVSPALDVVAFVRGSRPADCSGVAVDADKRAILTAAHCVCHTDIPIYGAESAGALSRERNRTLTRAQADDHCRSSRCIFIGGDINDAYGEKKNEAGRLFPIAGAALLYKGSCADAPGGIVRGKDLALVFVKPVADPGENSGWSAIKSTALVLDEKTYLREASRPSSVLHVVGFGRTGNCQGLPAINTKKYGADIDITTVRCRTSSLAGFLGCRGDRETVLIKSKPMDTSLRCIPDTCNGDSGGPAFMRLPVIKDGKPLVVSDLGDGTLVDPPVPVTDRYLAAITSRGISRFGGECGAGGVYTLVTPAVVQWMRAWGVNVAVRQPPKVQPAGSPATVGASQR